MADEKKPSALALFDKWAMRVLGFGRTVLCLALMVVIAIALFRLLGYSLPALRLTEANMQSLGIIIAAIAYALNALK